MSGATAIGSVCARSARQRNRLRLPDASRSRAIHGAARRQGRSSSFNEKRELEALLERIAALEAEQQGIQTRLADPAIYQQAPQEVPLLNERLLAIDRELDTALERWEALESKAAGA